jgi:hypothetical protein
MGSKNQFGFLGGILYLKALPLRAGFDLDFLATTCANTSDTRVAVFVRSGATGLVLGGGKDVVDLEEDLEATLAFKRFGFLRKRFFGFVGVKARARLAASLVLRTDSK